MPTFAFATVQPPVTGRIYRDTVHFRLGSCILLPGAPSDALGDGLVENYQLANVLFFTLGGFEEAPTDTLILTGHCDTVGGAESGLLAARRAEGVLAALTGDADGFALAMMGASAADPAVRFHHNDYNAPSFRDDVAQVMDFCAQFKLQQTGVDWKCAIGQGPFNQVFHFRRSWNQFSGKDPVATGMVDASHSSGFMSADAWGAVFSIYEEALSAVSPGSDDGIARLRPLIAQNLMQGRALACSRFQTRDRPDQPGVASHFNRRVELILVRDVEKPDLTICHDDPDQPVCKDSPFDCHLYRLGNFISREVEVRDLEDWTLSWSAAQVHPNGSATMRLAAPDMPDGVDVIFTVSSKGAAIGQVTVPSFSQGAIAQWSDWSSANGAKADFTFVVTSEVRDSEASPAISFVPPAGPPKVIAFFARPTAKDGRLETPRSLIVPRGTPLTVHSQTFGARNVFLHAKRVSGVVSSVPMPNQGKLELDFKPHTVTAPFTPMHDTTLLLEAFNGGSKGEPLEPIKIYVYDPPPGAQPSVHVDGGTFELV